MRVMNYIESQYRLLKDDIDEEYTHLYKLIDHPELELVLSTLHGGLVSLFDTMNSQLPSGETNSYFWAEPSRSLIEIIEIAEGLQKNLKETEYAFDIDGYYQQVITECKGFLEKSGGSTIPPRMEKIELYYMIPIFIPRDSVIVTNFAITRPYDLKLIGEGSYALVYKYRDEFYQKPFVLKRAKKELNEKEIERFSREFKQMKNLSSPYIVEVFCYDNLRNEYIMEYMDFTLYDYIEKNNTKLSRKRRKNIGYQILRAFEYVHSEGLLHRDISPKNILLKDYDDNLVVKICDFGLVKIQDSQLTSLDTGIKGYFNDPGLSIEGFANYGILHEIYALTRLLLFVMTGKVRVDNINEPKLQELIHKGLNPDKKQRFSNVQELYEAFKKT